MSSDDLKREFRPRFFALARKRVEKAHALGTEPTSVACEALSREMHSVAGEAGLLGIESVLGSARQLELASADLAKRPNDASTRDRFEHALAELEEALASSERPEPSSASVTRAKTVQEKFRARFVEGATARRQAIVRALDAGDEAGIKAALRELHTLGGEASMLAMTTIATICRDGEDAARRQDRAALAKVVEQLEIAILAEEPSRGER